jgi:hypothetical protein
MTKITTLPIRLHWTPLLPGLIELAARAETLSSRDIAASELRRMGDAAGLNPNETDRLVAAIVANPSDPDLLARLRAAALTADAKIDEVSK